MHDGDPAISDQGKPFFVGKSYSVGTRHDILERRHCLLCGLIAQMIPDESGQGSMGNVDEANTFYPSSHFTLSIPDFKNVLLRVTDASGRLICNIKADLDDSALGRPAEEPLRPGEIKGWISHCESDHQPKDSEIDKLSDSSIFGSLEDNKVQSSEEQTPVDVTLIDVERQCLVRGSTQERYIALSYVWGGVSGLQLGISNRSKLEAPGALLRNSSDILPLVRDVIDFVKSMGERYLWVDCLCIEQDNSLQKHFNISRMDIVYGQAIATLSVLSGNSANCLLPGLNSKRHRYRACCDFKWERMDQTNTIRLTAFSAGISATFKDSIYESRAWTLQERILSKRCIFVMDNMVVCTCHHGVLFSDRDDCLVSDQRLFRQNKIWLDSYVNPLIQAVNRGRYDIENKAGECLKAYVTLVHQYTSRNLSFEIDRLNAFTGILEGLLKLLGGSSIGGLLERILDYCLLWTHISHKGTQLPPIVRNRHFPSWTWAGWSQAKSYYNGPLYLKWMYKGGKQGWHHLNTHTHRPFLPDIYLSSKLEDIRISYETQPRSLTTMSLYESRNSFTESMSIQSKTPGFDVLHFTAETASLSQFSIYSVEDGLNPVRLKERDRCCGICYESTFCDSSGLKGDECIDVVLLSTAPCFLHDSLPLNEDTWEFKLNNDLCETQQSNCSVGHVMLIKWHGHRAERVGLATLQMGAWRLVERAKKSIQLV